MKDFMFLTIGIFFLLLSASMIFGFIVAIKMLMAIGTI